METEQTTTTCPPVVFESYIPGDRFVVSSTENGVDLMHDGLGNEIPFPLTDSFMHRLPYVLQEQMMLAPCEFSRTARLWSTLVATGTLMPHAYIQKAAQRYGAGMMLLIVGPAGCGKGEMEKVLHYLDTVNHEVEEENENRHRKHKQKQDAYNIAIKRLSMSDEERAVDDIQDFPDPVGVFLPHQLTCSKVTCAAFEKLVIGAQDSPMLIYSTEAKSIIGSNNNRTWGNYYDILHKAAMEEPITKDLSEDALHISNPTPRLSLMVSGVTGDLQNFFPNGTSDGLASRMILLHLAGWVESYDDAEVENHAELYSAIDKRTQEQLTNLYHILDAHSGVDAMQVTLSNTQRVRLDRDMEKLKVQYMQVCSGEDIGGLANRQRLLFRRLCMALEVWNNIDHNGQFVYPSNGRLAVSELTYGLALELVHYNMQQHIHFYNHFLRTNVEQRETINLSCQEEMWQLLLETAEINNKPFTAHEVFDLAEKRGIKIGNRSIYRWLNVWCAGEHPRLQEVPNTRPQKFIVHPDQLQKNKYNVTMSNVKTEETETAENE